MPAQLHPGLHAGQVQQRANPALHRTQRRTQLFCDDRPVGEPGERVLSRTSSAPTTSPEKVASAFGIKR
ncbi:hypothetical protein [Nocardioides sp.]|uniref:hypothetical protein n=1 Tax=Nocardioides sp. TaxID=35761 RepID=UPI0019C7FA6E|nr:hypothetical protein [Nocardioides sp.]MBC7275673.1 hypothetical protein [Nocardioides sp.]